MSSYNELGTSQHEGRITSAVEHRTANIPSIAFLTLAGASLVGSAVLYFLRRNEDANFVGQWVPTLLIIGLYNKLVKQNEMGRASGVTGH